MDFFSHNPKMLLDALYDPEEQEAMYHPVYDEIIDRENVHRARATAGSSNVGDNGLPFRWQIDKIQEQDDQWDENNINQNNIKQDMNVIEI